MKPIFLDEIVAPAGGYATHTRPHGVHAVDFLIQSIHKYPHQVVIFAIGPLSNIALALLLDPTIAPLIRKIVIMGGQIEVPGNSFCGAAEFNWWFDAEAAQIVLRAKGLQRLIVPLDLTDTVPMTQEVYWKVRNCCKAFLGIKNYC